MRVATFPLIAIPWVAACAAPATDYPSLAIREAERIVPAPAPVADPGPGEPVPADLAGRVADLRTQAMASDRAFREKEPGVTRQLLAARGAAIASKSWSGAQTALSDLASHRGATAIALADLDQLHAARALQLQRRDFIDEARSDIAAILARQDETLQRMRGMIRP